MVVENGIANLFAIPLRNTFAMMRSNGGNGTHLASDDVPIAALVLAVTGKELARYAESKGWWFLRRGGRASHVIYAHPNSPHRITISIHRGRDVPKGLLAVLLKKINNP